MAQLFNVVTLLRLVAFMVLVYVAIGWIVERKAGPESKLKAFFRIVCSPVTWLVKRRMAPGTPMERIFRVSFLAVAAVWIGIILIHRFIQPKV